MDRGFLPTGVAWLALAALPLAADDWQLAQLAQFVCYGIFAMSLAFVWGQAGLLCFGQAVFFGIGAYLMAVVTKDMVPGLPDGTAIGLAAAVLGASGAAFVAGTLLFRGRGLSGAYFAIVTLAAAVIVERAASHIGWLGGFNGLMNVPPLRLGLSGRSVELFDAAPVYYLLLGTTLLVYALLLAVERSPTGTVLRAIRDDDRRTAYFGYDVARYKILAFTIAGAVAGLAGGLFATQFGFVAPTLIGVGLSTEVLIWTALGGRSVLLAAFLGAIVVRTAEAQLSDLLGSYWLLALGLLFVVSVTVLPSGLLGRLLRLPLPQRMAVETAS
jgi:branched-chain amino acid transport system permease protein/urea transport system permease protein